MECHSTLWLMGCMPLWECSLISDPLTEVGVSKFKKFAGWFAGVSLAFGAGTVYGSVVASGVAVSMCQCAQP